MRLRVLLPTEVLVDEDTVKVIAEAANGSFCLLPRHVDFVAALVSGLLFYTTPAGTEKLLAVDEGTLVKCGDEVLVSVLHAACGKDAATLQQQVVTSFQSLDEDERRARSALARLEAATMRQFFELERRGRG